MHVSVECICHYLFTHGTIFSYMKKFLHLFRGKAGVLVLAIATFALGYIAVAQTPTVAKFISGTDLQNKYARVIFTDQTDTDPSASFASVFDDLKIYSEKAAAFKDLEVNGVTQVLDAARFGATWMGTYTTSGIYVNGNIMSTALADLSATNPRYVCSNEDGLITLCGNGPATYSWETSAWGSCTSASLGSCEGSWTTTTAGGSCEGVYTVSPASQKVWIDNTTAFNWVEHRVYNGSRVQVGSVNSLNPMGATGGTCSGCSTTQDYYMANQTEAQYKYYYSYSTYTSEGHSQLSSTQFNQILSNQGSVRVHTGGINNSEWYKARWTGSGWVRSPVNTPNCSAIWCGDQSSTTDAIVATQAQQFRYDYVCPEYSACNNRYTPTFLSCLGPTSSTACTSLNRDCSWVATNTTTVNQCAGPTSSTACTSLNAACTWNEGATGTQTRTVTCKDNLGAVVPDGQCTTTKPATSQSC